MYSSVSRALNGSSVHRTATRCFNCRNEGSLRRAAELRLPGQDDREQLATGRVDVAEEPYFLQEVQRHGVRFVDHEGSANTALQAAEQHVLEAPQQCRLGGRRAELEPIGHRFQELRPGQRGVLEDDGPRPEVLLPGECALKEDRLSQAHLADQHGQALTLTNRVLNRRERFLVPIGEVEKLGSVVSSKGKAVRPKNSRYTWLQGSPGGGDRQDNKRREAEAQPARTASLAIHGDNDSRQHRQHRQAQGGHDFLLGAQPGIGDFQNRR